eukprot:CAMPEP_0170298612 /NCGR_PEP_ID=MMETSP0116_2-20130129/49490_1 /TAXON_ID=400756 /ORGANISM="Durinskia baltica, Strain CSIRO CS-38" /LENGTH=174 /DNA_ID=CAMNT_0010550283 /DNA_START=29 /DNA_END=553 /DNA_ORIENTATION=+
MPSAKPELTAMGSTKGLSRARFDIRFATPFSKLWRKASPIAIAVCLARATIISNVSAGMGPALCKVHTTPRAVHRPTCKTALPAGILRTSSASQSNNNNGLSTSHSEGTMCTQAPAARSRNSTLASANANDAAAKAVVGTEPSSSSTRTLTSKARLAYRSKSTIDSRARCSMQA